MGNRYRENISALKEYNPYLLKTVLEWEGKKEDAKELKAEDGIFYFCHEDQYYQLCSQNKLEEADILTRDLEDTRDYMIVLFGMGNMPLIEKLLRDTTDDTKVMVVEPITSVFFRTMRKEKWKPLLETGRLAMVMGSHDEMKRIIRACMGQKWDNLVHNIKILMLPNYYVFNEILLDAVKIIGETVDIKLKSMGNCLEDVINGLTNNYKNVDACLRSNRVSEIRGKYEGYPAIVVASGPSLDKNIKYLKEAKGKALIIACDASYSACIENGAEPDIIASIERDIPTYEYYYKGKHFDKDLVLVGPSSMWPDIYEEFPGKMILVARNNDGIEKWWSDQNSNIEFLSTGHSCANVAYAIANAAGCSPVILIGQDLGFTDNKIHSQFTHTEAEGANDAGEGEADERWVEDIYGGKVKTDIFYNLFRAFFEEQIFSNEKLLIDATEGGALIRGSKIMTFREAIDTYCIKDHHLRFCDFLEDLSFDEEKAVEKYKTIIEAADDILERLEDVRKKAMDHIIELKKYEEFDFDSASEEELIKIVIKMQPGNEIVRYITEEQRPLITYYQQNIKQTIIYVKKIGNELNGSNVKRNWVLQANLMYMLQIASVEVIKQYQKMKAFMEEKLKQRRRDAE